MLSDMFWHPKLYHNTQPNNVRMSEQVGVQTKCAMFWTSWTWQCPKIVDTFEMSHSCEFEWFEALQICQCACIIFLLKNEPGNAFLWLAQDVRMIASRILLFRAVHLNGSSSDNSLDGSWRSTASRFSCQKPRLLCPPLCLAMPRNQSRGNEKITGHRIWEMRRERF